MPKTSEFTFPSCDGKREVHVREWLPEGETRPRGVVQISHGIAEHIERYADFAAFLTAKGYAVVGNDHIGHGSSLSAGEEHGFFSDSGGWDFVVGDARRLYELTREKHPETPYFLLGHSMGSFVARTYIIHYTEGLHGVILSGTGQQSGLLLRLGLIMAEREVRKKGPSYKSEKLDKLCFGSYNKRISPARTAKDWLSRDEAVVDAYVADERCGYVAAAATIRDMLTGIKYISSARNLKLMDKNLPVHFFSGDADPVGGYGKGVLRAYKAFTAAGMKDVTLKLYDGGRHEMLNELNRKEVYSDILAWLDSKL